MEPEEISQPVYSEDKIIYDHVRFENVQIIYDTRQDIEVEFVADPLVKGSGKDWVGIYEANWKDFGAFLVTQSVFGARCDDSGRRRKIKYKSKWLTKAKPNTHYQFVYINKYLEIMGVSQYFQMRTDVEGGPNSLIDTSISAKPCSSPVKKEAKQDNQFLNMSFNLRPTNCKLYGTTKFENLCTTCHHCKGIFSLKASCDKLLREQKEYRENIENLQDRIRLLETCLEWEKNKEKDNFRAYIWRISQAVFHQDENKSMGASYFDWDCSRKELYLKAVAGHQEIIIQQMHKVICESRLLQQPSLVSLPTKRLEDTVQKKKTDESDIAEVCELNNTSEDETNQ